MSRNANVDAIATITTRALWASGFRKLDTPSEIASSPVSDAPPLAYARNSVRNATPIKMPWPPVPSR